MNANLVEEYLRAVDEMVMDEEKIVTYKLLSRTLGLNVNTAKQLLHCYAVKQQNITPSTLSATHLLAGLLRDGTFLVSVISDDKLEEAYSKYDKITSEHVYSIQKGKASGLEKNSQMLFTTDSALPPPKGYVIKYYKNLEEKIIEKAHTKTTNQSVDVKIEVEFDEKRKECKVGTASTLTKEEKLTTKKPGHISNFFNNQSQKKKVVKEEVKSESSRMKDVPKKVDEPEEIVEITEEKPSSSSKSKKKAVVTEKKKRKRILSASEDSDSDEEKRDALLCGEPEVSEMSHRLRITDDDSNEDDLFENKRKRKKIISKNVLHDDGFMETFKEVVYETDSDSESSKNKKEAKMDKDEVPTEKVEKEEAAGRKGKKAPLQKTKQSTLFSFFKKN